MKFSLNQINFMDLEVSADDSLKSTTPRNSGGRGRPETSFSESSDRSKRRKAQKLRDSYSAQELSYATKMVLRESGATLASKVVADVTSTSPMRASK